MELGDVVNVEGRDGVCVSAKDSTVRVLGGDRFVTVRVPTLAGRSLRRSVEESLSTVAAGARVLANRVPMVVQEIVGDEARVEIDEKYCSLLIHDFDRLRQCTDKPLPRFMFAPRIDAVGCVRPIEESPFIKHLGLDLLWDRSQREEALVWFAHSDPNALADAALEAHGQIEIAPVRLCHGRLLAGSPLVTPSPNDQWVAKNATLAWFRAQTEPPRTVALQLTDYLGRIRAGEFIELLTSKSKTKKATQIVEAVRQVLSSAAG